MNIHGLYDRLSSIRLTIFLCILLAALSVLGTVIPQNAPPEQYEAMYGSGLARIVTRLGLTDLYHSTGFVILLCLLAANLVACTAKRLPGTWRSLRKDASLPSESGFESWKCREAFACSAASTEAVDGQLERIVARALGKRPREVDAGSGLRAFLVERNRYARLGPYLAHVSILIILLGASWGALAGFRGVMQLAEGEVSSDAWLQTSAKRLPLGFQVRCDRFVIDQYPDGTPKEYRSEVSFLDNEGESILKGNIRVNHPLTYSGISFYQSTYGSIPEVELRIRDRETGEESLVRTKLNNPFLVPGKQGDRAMAVGFQEDLRIPEEMARITSFPRQSLGPAARIVVFDQGGFSEPFWVFRDLPEFAQRKDLPYQFVLRDFRLIATTGLQVVKDPGTPLVWIGCTLLVIGFLVALLMDHEIVWVTGEVAGERGYMVRMAGRAVRHPGVYTARFERQKQRLRRGLSPWMNP